MKIDKKIIKELSDYLDEFNLTELEYTEKDTKIKVSKNNISIKNQTNPSANENHQENKLSSSKNTKTGLEITSPIIGDLTSIPVLFFSDELFKLFVSVFGLGTFWLFTEILFLETLILVSFSVYSSSVRLNSSK